MALLLLSILQPLLIEGNTFLFGAVLKNLMIWYVMKAGNLDDGIVNHLEARVGVSPQCCSQWIELSSYKWTVGNPAS